MKHNTLNRIGPILLMALGALCAIAYLLIGAETGSGGILREPFFLVGAAYFFGFLGLTWGVIALFTRGMQETRNLPLAFIMALALAIILFTLSRGGF